MYFFSIINHRTYILSHLVIDVTWYIITQKNIIKTSATPAGQYTRVGRAVLLTVYLVTSTEVHEMANQAWGTFLLNYIYILRPLPGEGQPGVQTIAACKHHRLNQERCQEQDVVKLLIYV